MMTFFKEAGALDYLAFGGIAFLVIRGFMRGCSGELGRLVGTVAAAGIGYFGFGAIARLRALFFRLNCSTGTRMRAG